MRASRVAILAVTLALLAAPALAQSPSPAAPAAPKPPAAAPASPPTAPTKPEAAKPESPADKAALVDINSASAQELGQLKGIGEARSAAIVKGRPYRGKDDLLHKKIIPEAVYAEIKDRIVARQK